MEQQEKNDTDILITRYLSGEAGEEEILELRKWINRSKDNLVYFRQLKTIWEHSGSKKISAKISPESAYQNIGTRIKPKTRQINIWLYWQRIAAILVIPLVLGNIIYFIINDSKTTANEPVFNELYAAFGTRSALKLSDGSLVWLNSGSSIKYPDKFIGKERIVYLNGEAYFEVESNPERPFIVRSPKLVTRATGTKFNVSDYMTSTVSEITLLEGKVNVNHLDGDQTGNLISALIPNQHLTIDNLTDNTVVTDEDTYKYIAWKDGKLIFRNEPLTHVVQELSQIYNIDIVINSPGIKNYTYRATFQDESIEEILKLLKMSSPIDYIEPKREPLSDGTFPRKKIIIIPAK